LKPGVLNGATVLMPGEAVLADLLKFRGVVRLPVSQGYCQIECHFPNGPLSKSRLAVGVVIRYHLLYPVPRRTARLLSSLFLFLYMASVIAGAPPLLEPQRIKAGDVISVLLKEPANAAPDVSNVYTVSERGMLRLTILPKEVLAAGLTREELATSLVAACAKDGVFKNAVFTVKLSRPIICIFPVVIVGGEVKSGGVQVGIGGQGMRIRTAIERAGGFTQKANTQRVKLVRDGAVRALDLSVEAKGDENNPVLMDGDMIVVPARSKTKSKGK
jgi:protein involved in polysaccharide export with SLBB domain